jgi:hypothetical protein
MLNPKRSVPSQLVIRKLLIAHELVQEQRYSKNHQRVLVLNYGLKSSVTLDTNFSQAPCERPATEA